MARRLPALLAAAVAALSVVACAGVPSSGPVRVIRRVQAEAPEVPVGPAFRRQLPPNPPVDGKPEDIVRGYLLAQGSSDGDHAIARKYLAPGVSWNPTASLTVYTSPRTGAAVVTGSTAKVTVTVERVGTISAAGEFRPPLTATAPVVFSLRRVEDGWRLASAPAGLLLNSDDLSNAYQRVTLYFPSPTRRLVPHQLFLRASDQPATAVMRALLGGPRGWIAPAVRTAIPDGTELLEPPTVVDGVISVNLSREIRRAPQETLGALIAQIVWTLTEPSLSVNAVRLLAEGEALAAPGRGSLREHRRTDWEEFSPTARPDDERLFFVRDFAPVAVDATGRTSRVAEVPPIESFAVSRSGSHLAAVTRLAGGRQSLVIADLSGGGPARTVLSADRVTAPTWEPGGGAVWVAARNGGATQVVAVPASPGPVAGVESSLPAGEISALRLSPDGARAAAIIAGIPGPALWMARVQRTANGARALADPRAIAPSVSRVTAVAFDVAGQVVVAGVLAGVRTVVRVDLDGYTLSTLRVQGLPSAPIVALASSASTPPDRVASAGGRLWRRTPGADWAPIAGSGTAATYAG